MTLFDTIPRRCVNLPPGSVRTFLRCLLTKQVVDGDEITPFCREFGKWLRVAHVVGAATGRSAVQMAIKALELPEGAEIIFPSLTFPVVPLLAKHMGYTPVFCPVDPRTFNAGARQIEPLITDKTGAVLATHLFGRPCPIEEIVSLCRARDIHVLEDCAHACGARIAGKSLGTFGDLGIFSFAQGKNMPCFGGGAVVTNDPDIARRLRAIEEAAPLQHSDALCRHAWSIWLKWLVTRPWVFSMTAYPVLRLRQLMGNSLMDNATGDALLEHSSNSEVDILRMANLQAALGRLHLPHLDTFNMGSQRNGRILNTELLDIPGIGIPSGDTEHIYVYYALRLNPGKRDDLRNYLLRRGIDTKTTDMADCTRLAAFQSTRKTMPENDPDEASLLEICVYPTVSESGIRRIARTIRRWSAS